MSSCKSAAGIGVDCRSHTHGRRKPSQAPPKASRSFSTICILPCTSLYAWAPDQLNHQSSRRPARKEPLILCRYTWIRFILVQPRGLAITIVVVGTGTGSILFYSLLTREHLYLFLFVLYCLPMQGVVSVHREGKQNINQQSALCSIGSHRCRSGEYSCTGFLWCMSPQTIYHEQEGCLQTPCFQMCRPPAHTKYEPALLKWRNEICSMHQCNRMQGLLLSAPQKIIF